MILIRKVINIGPFRINISKSGIGISFGVKELRTGPKGEYISILGRRTGLSKS